MDNICPPKAEATGSNPVGCASFSAVSGYSHQPHARRTVQEHARSKPERAYNARTGRKATWAERFAERQERYRREAEQRMAEQVALMDAASDLAGFCYFFASTDGRVKIGYSADVYRRLAEVRRTTLFRTIHVATARGGRSRESYYHWLFDAHRIDGEWFALRPDIIQEVDRLRSLNPADPTKPPAPRQRDGLPQTVGGSHG